MNYINLPLIIVGSGIAALTASIYVSRAKINHILVSGSIEGGQLITSTEIENFPGIPLISGYNLMKNIVNHTKAVGGNIITDNILQIDMSTHPFKLTGSINTYTATSLIIATGSFPSQLGLKNEKELTGKGVSYCATCDGHFYKNQDVAVIGGGNTAIEEALYLSNIAKTITLIHRNNTLRGEKILQEKLFNNSKIKILWDHEVTRLHHDNDKLSKIELINNKTNCYRELEVQAMFIAIGHKPSTDFLQNQLELDAGGYIITTNKTSQTSIKGVFAAGDVQNPHYKQAIISAGSGAIAALDAIKFLMNK